MTIFIKQLIIQFKMDVREKGTLLTFYAVPMIFYLIMGAVFSSINPEAKQVLAATMAIFAATMGAVLGLPSPLIKMRESETIRAFRVNGIPGWSVLLVQATSAFLHLMIVTVIILVTSPLFFGAEVPTSILAFLAVLCLLLFSSISVGLVIGVMAKSQSMATMLAQAVFLPSLMTGGIMFPSSMLPKPLMYFGRIFPATHAMESFTAFAYMQTGTINPYLSISILVLIGVAASLLSARRFANN